MYGGNIIGYDAGNYNGGGVRIENGTFSMQGGSIRGCKSIDGGGVYVLSGGSFTMSGNATIEDNTAQFGSGGGVYLNVSTFNLSGAL